MNMFARFDENPAMTLQDIKKTKCYGWTDTRTHGCTHEQRENSIPTTNKICEGKVCRGYRAGEGISEPLSDILYNMLSDELFKHPATQIESLVLSCH